MYWSNKLLLIVSMTVAVIGTAAADTVAIGRVGDKQAYRINGTIVVLSSGSTIDDCLVTDNGLRCGDTVEPVPMLASFEEALMYRDNQIAGLQQDIAELKRRLATAEDENAVHNKRIAEMQHLIDDAMNIALRKEQELKKVNATLTVEHQQVTELQELLAGEQLKVVDLQGEQERLSVLLNKIREERTQLLDNQQQLQAQLREKEAAILTEQSKNTVLSKRLDELGNVLAKSDSQSNTLRHTLREHQASLQAVQDENTSQQQRIAALNATIDEQQKHIASIEEAYTRLEHEYEAKSSQDSLIAQYDQQMNDLRSALRKQQENLQDSRNQNIALQQQITELNDQIKGHQQTIATLEKTPEQGMESQQLIEYRQRIQALEQQIDEQSRTVASMQNVMDGDTQSRMIAGLRSTVERLHEQLRDKNIQISNLRLERDNSAGIVAAQQKTIAAMQSLLRPSAEE